MAARTPMLQQYFDAKQAHPGVLMAMRVGDFYEFYGEDAETAAGILQITLTGREDGPNGRISMAGVPYHSVEKYLAKLVASGQKVALCDQVEDPKTAKGLVRRAVTRVLTPGTVVEDSMLQAGSNNFLAAVAFGKNQIGVAVLDTSTGEFLATEINPTESSSELIQELARLNPVELLLESNLIEVKQVAEHQLGISVAEAEPIDSRRAEKMLVQQFKVSNLSGFGLAEKPSAQAAAAMILQYAESTGLVLDHVSGITNYSVSSFMAIDPATRRALEISANLADGSRRYTLLSVVDYTVTSMGSRLLRRWLDQPLLERPVLEARLDAVEGLVRQGLHRADLRDSLKKIADLERLVSRCAARLAHPRDLSALRSTLAALPEVLSALQPFQGTTFAELRNRIDVHEELSALLQRSLVPDPPLTLRDGGIIADGYDAELDALRSLSREGRKYISEIETRERERTGISNLKIGYNSVFGYYLEVGKAQQAKVPPDYIRKQTTTTAERYVTAELKDREASVLGAGERASALETEIFHRIRAKVTEESVRLMQTARALAEVDVLCSFGEVSSTRGYKKPSFVDEDVLEIVSGRHPVVEANTSQFVPNDASFEVDGMRIMLLTGPNMSGKSTYLRQTALIVLLAQVGCFVPAKSCRLGICDRIFARIGAKDEIALGQSTFMVEMMESAYIMHHATERSLVLFDEVGRGTSTYDGLAIAWAMIEHLDILRAKTMFATHYHQLNSLADSLASVRNYRVSVREVGDEIIWAHKVLPGGTDKSYGIYVAQKAGMPPAVLRRASEVLADLENKSSANPVKVQRTTLQLSLFEQEDPWIVKELKEIDVDSLTPIQAITLLGKWKEKAGPISP